MNLGSLLNQCLHLVTFLPEDDLLCIIKSALTLLILSVLNGFLDHSLEAEDNELFIKVGLTLLSHVELLVCLFNLV